MNRRETGRKRDRERTDRFYLTMCPLLWLELHRWHPASWLGRVWTFHGQCFSGLPPESWNSEQTGPWHRLWIGQLAAGKMEAPHWKLKKKIKIVHRLKWAHQSLCPLRRKLAPYFNFMVLNKVVKYFKIFILEFIVTTCNLLTAMK